MKNGQGGGGGANRNPKYNPGIYFYGGFRKTSQGGWGGGGAIWNPKKVRPNLKPGSATANVNYMYLIGENMTVLDTLYLPAADVMIASQVYDENG